MISTLRLEADNYIEGMEEEEDDFSTLSLETNKRGQSYYPPAFKLEVALYANTYSQYAASKVFCVARRRIFDWSQQVDDLQQLVEAGQPRRVTGREPRSRTVDQTLYEWYQSECESGHRPRSSRVREQAVKLFHQHGIHDMKESSSRLVLEGMHEF